MSNANRLAGIKDDIFIIFSSLFHDPKVAKKEWQNLWDAKLNPTDTLKLITQRFKTVNKISQTSWKNPVHIVAQLIEYRNISSFQAALALLDEAKTNYKNNFLPLITGNLSLSFEVGFNCPTGDTDKPIFNIHAHIICENDSYTTFLNATKDLRTGKSSKYHKLATRKCKRLKQQSNMEYTYDVANYNTKFSLLQGMSRNNKRANALPNAKEYYKAKLNLQPVLRLKKPKKSSWKWFYSRLKQLVSRYLKWHILITMQGLKGQFATFNSIKSVKKARVYHRMPHYNEEIYSFPDSC